MSISRRAVISGLVAIACLAPVAFGSTGCEEDKKLKVAGIDPDKGDYLGGQYVRVKGNRFVKDGMRSVKVFFGGVQANVLRFSGDNELIVQAPGGKPGQTVDVEFQFEPGGYLKMEKAFTFVEVNNSTVDDLTTKPGSAPKAPAAK